MNYLIIVLTAFIFVNCSGSKNNKSSIIDIITKPASASVKVKYNGEVIGYVFNIYNNVAHMYNPKLDRYVKVNLLDGTYQETTGYYSQENCEGDLFYGGGFIGTSSKSIEYINGKYYLIGMKKLENEHDYLSSSSPYHDPKCTNAINGPYTIKTTFYSTTEVQRPYNYESIAPLELTYE